MYGIKRPSYSFMSGVSKFVEVVKLHAHSNRTKQICCPCFDCKNNIVWENTDVIKTHLIQRGFIADYKVWIHHGEAQLTGNTCVNNVNDEVHDADEDDDEDPGDHGMMHDGDLENENGDHAGVNDDLRAQEEEEHDINMEEVLLGSAKGLEHFETLKKAAKDCMYDGCGKGWTVLRFVLHLLI